MHTMSRGATLSIKNATSFFRIGDSLDLLSFSKSLFMWHTGFTIILWLRKIVLNIFDNTWETGVRGGLDSEETRIYTTDMGLTDLVTYGQTKL